jgi:hypothetical protein
MDDIDFSLTVDELSEYALDGTPLAAAPQVTYHRWDRVSLSEIPSLRRNRTGATAPAI